MVILVDLRMNASKEGCPLLELLCQAFPFLKIIALSPRLEDAAMCYLLGAKAFFHVLKLEGLQEAISGVSDGNTVILPEVAAHLLQQSRGAERTNLLRLEMQRFSRRELEILSLLRKGIDRKSISECLFISDYTVKRHLENALAKTPFRVIREVVARYADLLPEIHHGPENDSRCI